MIKPKQIEKIAKGFANHHRVEILQLLEDKPELSLLEVSDKLKMNFKTASEHIRKLALANLIMKRYEGAAVRHALTENGKLILKFFRTLE